MTDTRLATMSQEEELLDVLLELIIVTASLTKKVNLARKMKEGGYDAYEKDVRNFNH